MNFHQVIDKFENEVNEKFEILEFHYLPYSFGSGTKCYRIKGRNIKLVYNGKEELIEIHVSPYHEKYPTNKWDLIFSDTYRNFNEKGLNIIKKKIIK
jgi:hypothetical protein